MADTEISWTEKVWNCLRGCTRVSPGCGQGKAGGCYAERMAYRFSGKDQPYEGLVKLTSGGPRWTGEVACIESKLEDPLRWKKPARIFVNSMSDIFHEAVPDEFIDKMFAVMAMCPQHTFQVLTKRAARMEQYLTRPYGPNVDGWIEDAPRASCKCVHEARQLRIKLFNDPYLPAYPWPLPNVHIGVSVEDQQRADERIPHLLRTPAAVRWISAEPLLGPVDLTKVGLTRRPDGREVWTDAVAGIQFACDDHAEADVECNRLSWVVIGCESGLGMRPFEDAWARRIISDCKAAGVPVHVKQIRVGGKVSHDPTAWPADLQVREEARCAA